MSPQMNANKRKLKAKNIFSIPEYSLGLDSLTEAVTNSTHSKKTFAFICVHLRTFAF